LPFEVSLVVGSRLSFAAHAARPRTFQDGAGRFGEVRLIGGGKSDPISLDTVSTTMTAAKEVDDERTKAEADSWQ